MALVRFDDIAHFAGSKAFAVVGGIIGGVAVVLWNGIGAVRRWFRSRG
jgi:hypothetical protein